MSFSLGRSEVGIKENLVIWIIVQIPERSSMGMPPVGSTTFAFWRRSRGVTTSVNHKLMATTGATHHRNFQSTGVASDVVEGAVFAVTKQELEQADEYEKAAGYERVLVQLESGVSAWV